MENFKNWDEFFEKINFTFYRTSLIQNRYIEKILTLAKQIIKTSGTVKLMEIAGGSGYTTAVVADLLKNESATVYYSDLSPIMVEKIKKQFQELSYFANVDSNDIKFPDNYFDIIFHQGFLEHFEDSEIVGFLIEQARVAHLIVFDVPNSRRANKIQEFGNERFLTHRKWKELVKAAGLKIYEETGRRYNGWKRWMPAKILESDWMGRYFGESSIIICGK